MYFLLLWVSLLVTACKAIILPIVKLSTGCNNDSLASICCALTDHFARNHTFCLTQTISPFIVSFAFSHKSGIFISIISPWQRTSLHFFTFHFLPQLELLLPPTPPPPSSTNPSIPPPSKEKKKTSAPARRAAASLPVWWGLMASYERRNWQHLRGRMRMIHLP